MDMKKNSGKAPSFQFYPADWIKDGPLQNCSLEARGLWMDLICMSFHYPQWGVFRTQNGTVSETILLRMCNGNARKLARCFTELKQHNIIKQMEDGTFYVKRVKEDMELSKKRSEAGKQGGNPNLVGDLVKQNNNQNPTPSSSTSSSTPNIPQTPNQNSADSERLCSDDVESVLACWYKKSNMTDLNASPHIREKIATAIDCHKVDTVCRYFREIKNTSVGIIINRINIDAGNNQEVNPPPQESDYSEFDELEKKLTGTA